MMRLHSIVAFLLTVPVTVTAQFHADVRPGTRVRVWIPESARQDQSPSHRQLVRGTVESVNDGMLRLTVPGITGTVAIPRASVRRLDVSRGVSRGASMFERAVAGAIGGAIWFGSMNDPDNRTGPHYRTDWQAAGVGAAWGGGIGAAVGLLFPYERWRRVMH